MDTYKHVHYSKWIDNGIFRPALCQNLWDQVGTGSQFGVILPVPIYYAYDFISKSIQPLKMNEECGDVID